MKCPKCGYNNLKGATECGKCRNKLKADIISCPRCAYKNDSKTKKCIKCGYNLDKKESIFLNIFISIMIVGILSVLIFLNKKSLVSQIELIFKIIAVLSIIYIFVATLSFSHKNKQELKDELYTNPRIKRLEITSKLLLLIVGIMVLCICGYLYFKYIR